jgi:long-chain acyl-CoA synthetase
MGLADGDRVVLVAENCPEWAIADLAIMAAGCITTPAYTTNTERDHLHILENSDAKAVIVETGKLAQPLLPAVVRSGIATHVIGIEPLRQGQGPFETHLWSDLLEGDATAARKAVDARIAAIGRRDPACIIYTSGTSGLPRGVLLHHGAILCNVAGAAEVLAGDFGWGGDRFLSFLPLSHALEHTAGLYLPIGLGAEIWFAEGLDKLSSNIEEAQPTFMVVVPRLFELMRGRIVKQIEKQGRLANFVLDQALSLAERRAANERRLLDWPVEKLLELTLRPKIRARFGGRIKALVSGGAPLNPEIGAFFESMGLVMLQGYGQTESAPVVSCNYPSAGIKLDTVGPPLRGVEVRIAEDGEILVRGELVMLGYWRNEAETAKTVIDGWLHTGDIGHLDERGRIVITDRKKDIIVNDKGDNIAPQKLEGILTLQPEIGQAMVSGDRRPTWSG